MARPRDGTPAQASDRPPDEPRYSEQTDEPERHEGVEVLIVEDERDVGLRPCRSRRGGAVLAGVAPVVAISGLSMPRPMSGDCSHRWRPGPTSASRPDPDSPGTAVERLHKARSLLVSEGLHEPADRSRGGGVDQDRQDEKTGRAE